MNSHKIILNTFCVLLLFLYSHGAVHEAFLDPNKNNVMNNIEIFCSNKPSINFCSNNYRDFVQKFHPEHQRVQEDFLKQQQLKANLERKSENKMQADFNRWRIAEIKKIKKEKRRLFKEKVFAELVEQLALI